MNQLNKKNRPAYLFVYFIVGIIVAGLIISGLYEESVKKLNKDFPFLKFLFLIIIGIGSFIFFSFKKITEKKVIAVIDVIVGLYLLIYFGYKIWGNSLVKTNFTDFMFLLLGSILVYIGMRKFGNINKISPK